jgi:hypothetical protein
MEGGYPHGLLLAITNCTDPMAIRGRRGDRSLYFGRAMVYHRPQCAL